MFEYGYELEQDDNETHRLWFPDIPEAHSFGKTPNDIASNAREALEIGLSFYIEGWRPLPIATRGKSGFYASPSIQGVLKLAIYHTAVTYGLGRVELANKLQINPERIDRLLDLTHASHTDRLEFALSMLGKKIKTQLVET